MQADPLLAEISKDIQSVKLTLVKLETQVYLQGVERSKLIEDHENRLRVVERWRWSMPTAAVLATASIIVAVLV